MPQVIENETDYVANSQSTISVLSIYTSLIKTFLKNP